MSVLYRSGFLLGDSYVVTVIMRVDSVFYRRVGTDGINEEYETLYFSRDFGLIVPGRVFNVCNEERKRHEIRESEIGSWCIGEILGTGNNASFAQYDVLRRDEYSYVEFDEERVILAMWKNTKHQNFASITRIVDHEEEMIEELLE